MLAVESRTMMRLYNCCSGKVMASVGVMCQLPVMLTLWLKTVRPYIDIIDHWVSCGCLKDPRQEFFILRLMFVLYCDIFFKKVD